MHYKNGREAKNGDKVVALYAGSPVIGILYNAVAGKDYCNGRLALMQQNDPYANLKECLHFDDVLAATAAKEKADAPASAPVDPAVSADAPDSSKAG